MHGLTVRAPGAYSDRQAMESSMSHRSKPRRGPGSRGPSSPKPPPSRRANGGNGDGRHARGASEAKPSNGRANGGLEKTLQEQAGKAARSAPAIREDLVERYRKLIAEGRYHPDPRTVAERMIRKGLLRDL